MKHLMTWLCVFLIAVLAAPAALAKKDDKAKGEKKGGGQASPLYARFDLDRNGDLGGSELEAIRKAFADGDAEVRQIDSNADGVLVTEEIMMVPPGAGQPSPYDRLGKRGKGKKK